MANPRQHRHGAGRRLSGPPRAGLSGRLHPLAGAVAQAAGRALGRPGAVGRPAPRRRPRDGDRGASRPRNTGRSRPTSGRRQPDPFLARLVKHDGKRLSKFDLADEAVAIAAARRRRGRRPSPSPRSRRSRPGAPRPALHHLDPAAGSLAQARLQRPAHHAGGPEAVRRRRHRRRDRRPDHLYADRRRPDRRPRRIAEAREVIGDRFGPDYVPAKPRYLQDQGQERPGGPRSDPPDQPGAQPRLAAPGGRPAAGSTS